MSYHQGGFRQTQNAVEFKMRMSMGLQKDKEECNYQSTPQSELSNESKMSPGNN